MADAAIKDFHGYVIVTQGAPFKGIGYQGSMCRMGGITDRFHLDLIVKIILSPDHVRHGLLSAIHTIADEIMVRPCYGKFKV